MNRRQVWACALLLALVFLLTWAGSSLPDALGVTAALAALAAAARVAGRTMRQAIWRLRNRLLVTYLFIGVVPIVLILALAAVGTYIVTGQVAVYLVTSELERRATSLESHARFLSHAKAAERNAAALQLAPLIEDRLPGVEILLTGDQPFHYPAQSSLSRPSPEWKDFTGYVVKEGRYYCASVARTESPKGTTQAVLLAPIDAGLLAQLVPGIGIVNIIRGPVSVGSHDIAGRLPAAVNFLDFPTLWLGRVSFQPWENPGLPRRDAGIIIQTRPSAVLKAVFRNTDDSQLALVAFAVIASLLFAVEAFSLVIGVSLSRTITGAVHGLYEGTLKIAKGDFSHRIPVKGKDQLAELGNSFNEMTARLESLVEVAKEKERMQSELQIASEVQNQLFPRSAPTMKTIELVGICEPARMVSGDYFDYLRLPNGNLGIAIGDVAGKGISAALLMASIQSIMRTQLAAGPNSPALVVEQLNRQLYANTSAEKYATFFFGVYDDETRVLTYTNAGHLPPVLVRQSGAELLEVTGTVVGAFPSIRYEERTVCIGGGDVLIGYTDGISEPENAYGEEFGADRMSDLAARNRTASPADIAAKIMQAVTQWSSAAEMPDDMTVVIAKGLC